LFNIKINYAQMLDCVVEGIREEGSTSMYWKISFIVKVCLEYYSNIWWW